MTAEIISIGTEILLGNIVNTNAQYISKKLAFYGVDMYYQTVVGDNPERILDAVKIAFTRADMVITSGGLGPTKDDLTKETLAAYMGYEMTVDQKLYDYFNERARARGMEKATEGTLTQACIPKGAIILKNTTGTAPGCIMERDDKTMILLPGPPRELKPMFDAVCEDYIAKRSDRTIVSKCIYFMDFSQAPIGIVGESYVADQLGELVDMKNPTVATYAKPDSCYIRVTAAAKNHDEAIALIDPVIQQCLARLDARDYLKEIVEDI